MRTRKTLGLVAIMAVFVASAAVTPWWLVGVIAVAGVYLAKEVIDCVELIWSE